MTNHPQHRAILKHRDGKIPSNKAADAVSPFYSEKMRLFKTKKLKKLHFFIGLTLLSFGLTQYSTNSAMNKLRSRAENPHINLSSSFEYSDVLYLDTAAMKNVRATFEGARSWLKWATDTILDVTVADKLDQHQPIPLLATVDRRPLTARKQMKLDTDGLHDDGNLLGCAVTATTFVSKVENLYLDTMQGFPVECSVCFEFNNREDMNDFIPGVGFQPISGVQESTSTKCFGGVASNTARFVKWQSKDSRFEGFGYPFTVDCVLPNGIKELTCREISNMQSQIETSDGLQSIYFQTKFTLDAYFGDPYVKTFHTFSRWPWAAVQSHDDDRSKIAKSLPRTWNDRSSKFVPSSASNLKLLHIEGPGYSMGEFDKTPTLKSMKKNKDSNGGLHFRLLVNLFHLARNAPNSSHMMAIVDGQVHTSFNAMKKILTMKLDDVFKSYGEVFTDYYFLSYEGLVPKSTMKGKANKKSKKSKMTLGDLLRTRGVKLHIVPVTTPSLSFEKSVCGGQYTFAAYLAARFAADYHVMMYVDGDTAMIEGSNKSLQEILFERFYGSNSSKCAGHRIRLIEQYVQTEDDRTDRVLQCTEDMSLNPKKWEYANKNCHLKEGHIVARTDSILAMSVHHPDTDIDYIPEGVEDCVTPGNKENDRYFLKSSEFVQLHLRNRLRKDECVCFANTVD
jgi:hypothetical protein